MAINKLVVLLNSLKVHDLQSPGNSSVTVLVTSYVEWSNSQFLFELGVSFVSDSVFLSESLR